ncbi:MAG: hypothetical protein RMK89_10685 [Armatimonadota bacterium]|nr:hypothetical protein [Armatimonadota bacterium]MDW8143915.1 hypothetical protein [Armatimonadota bacterium]
MACPRQNFCGSNLTVCVSSVVSEQGASEIRSRRIMADLTRRKADFFGSAAKTFKTSTDRKDESSLAKGDDNQNEQASECE